MGRLVKYRHVILLFRLTLLRDDLSFPILGKPQSEKFPVSGIALPNRLILRLLRILLSGSRLGRLLLRRLLFTLLGGLLLGLLLRRLFRLLCCFLL